MNLSQLVRYYFDFRRIPMAGDKDALLYLQTEVGGLVDARMRKDSDWVRNNDCDTFEAAEIGDVLMMLTAYAISRGLDPIDCMFAKMRTKGFNV